MKSVTEYLKNLIVSQVEKHHVIVWYDPEEHYGEWIDRTDFGGIPILKYDASYFKLRYELESYISGQEPEKVIVYVPEERNRSSSPLIEAECCGKIIEPGGASGRNTRLELVARWALGNVIMNDDAVEEICKQVAAGSLSIFDLDKIAERGIDSGYGTVVLIFGTTDFQQIALSFLSSTDHDEAIIEKNGLDELKKLMSIGFGMDEADAPSPQGFRRIFARHVLVTDFLDSIDSGKVVEQLQDVPHASKRPHIQACSDLVRVWRNRLDLRDSYVAIARQIETDLDLRSLEFDPKTLLNSHTFEVTESSLLAYSNDLILDGKLDEALILSERRKSTFWALANPAGILMWSMVDSAAGLIRLAAIIKQDLKLFKGTAKDMVIAYAEGYESNEPWCSLDLLHRSLEKQYIELDLSSVEHGGKLDQIATVARKEYDDISGLMSRAFLEALEKSGFELPGIIHQRDIYDKYVRPGLEDEKTAYVWVDALRFEMGKELLDALESIQEKSIEYAVAGIPTETSVCMSALASGQRGPIGISKGNTGLAVEIDGSKLSNRQDRIKFISKQAGVDTLDLKLQNLLNPGKSTKSKMEQNQVIIVTSQEIDEICEGDSAHIARKVMGEVLSELARAVRNLVRMGVTHIVIAADHGYIFGKELTDDMKIDPPDGDKLDLSRRYWIGRGGSTSNACVRVRAEVLGIRGDLELVFPKTLGCFKVQGGSASYFHGGLSLQELIIPVLDIHAIEQIAVAESKADFEISMSSPHITTRFFSVEVSYRKADLFDGNTYRIRLSIQDGKKEVGVVVAAAYGFQEGTQEIVLKKDETNYITLMLADDAEMKTGTVSIHVLDAKTGLLLAKLDGVSVEIAI